MKISFLLLSFLLIQSCNTPFSQTTVLQSVNLKLDSSNTQESINLSQIFSACSTVRLETTSKSLIGAISDVKFSDELIFVGDGFVTDAIFVFRNNGEFVNKISKKGKGPGEYIRLDSFDINESKKEIYILDNQQSKLVVYDFDSKFLREIKLGFRAFNFVFDSNKFYFDRQNAILRGDNSDKFNLFICNNEGEITKQLIEYLPYVHNYGGVLSGGEPVQIAYKGQISYISALDNRVIEISNDEVVREFVVNYDRFPKIDIFKKIDAKHTHPLTVLDIFKEEGYVINFRHLSSRNNIYFEWKEGEASRFLWYNKKTNNHLFSKALVNDLNDMPIGRLFYLDNNFAYSYIEDLSILSERVLTENNIKIDSNPIIIKYTIKQ